MGADEPGGSAPGPEVEVQLLRPTTAPVDEASTTTAATDGGRRIGPLVVVGLLLAAVIGGTLVDRLRSDEREEAAPTTSIEPGPTTAAPTEPTTTAPRPTTAPTTTAAAEAVPFPALRLLPDAPPPSAALAVMPIVLGALPSTAAPPERPRSLWLVEDGRTIHRDDLPDLGTDLVVVGRSVVAGARTLIGVDLATGVARDLRFEGLPPGETIVGLLPGADDTQAWALTATDASVDAGAVVLSGESTISLVRLSFRDEDVVAGEPLPVELPWWPVPVAGGVVRTSEAGAEYQAADGRSTPLTSLGDGPWFAVAGGGDLAAAVSEAGGGLRVVDVRADTIVAEAPPPDSLLGICFAPDQRYLALRHFRLTDDGPTPQGLPAVASHVTVLDLSRPDPEPNVIELGEPVTDITWTSGSELVVSTPEHLLAVDVATGASQPFAEVAGADRWLVASEGGC